MCVTRTTAQCLFSSTTAAIANKHEHQRVSVPDWVPSERGRAGLCPVTADWPLISIPWPRDLQDGCTQRRASCVYWQQPVVSLDRSPGFLLSCHLAKRKRRKSLRLVCLPLWSWPPSCQAHRRTLNGLALFSSLLSCFGSPRLGGTKEK